MDANIYQKLMSGQTILSFGRGNAKLSKEIATFSLPAGYSCPGARECLAKAERSTGKLTDGGAQRYRCFSATTEAAFSSVRVSRWANFEALKDAHTREAMAQLIGLSLPESKVVRIHVGGDFFNAAYFLAWCDVARSKPAVTFYAYTKEIKTWIEHLGEVPPNLILTASFGGRYDSLIEEHQLKSVRVVFTTQEALALGLTIDHDDINAYATTQSFALLLHGMQPRGSNASVALKALNGTSSYSKGHKRKTN